MLFGSDYPFVDLKRSVLIVKSMGLSNNEEDVYCDNTK